MDERLSWPSQLTYGRLFTTYVVTRQMEGKFACQSPTFYHCATLPTFNARNSSEVCGVNRLEKEYSTIRTKELEEQVELRVSAVRHLTQ